LVEDKYEREKLERDWQSLVFGLEERVSRDTLKYSGGTNFFLFSTFILDMDDIYSSYYEYYLGLITLLTPANMRV